MSMIIVNRIGDNIVGSVNGKQFGVSFNEKKYEAMLDLQAKANAAASMDELQAIVDQFTPLTQESYKELVETACPYIVANPSTNKYYLRFNNTVSSKAMPQTFVDKIIKSIEKGLPIDPLIKCWARFIRTVPGRPEYTEQRGKLFADYISAPYRNTTLAIELQEKSGLSAQVANDRATTPQVAITLEGLIVGYKVSREWRIRYELNEEEERVVKSRFKPQVDPDTGLVTYDEPQYVEDRLFEPVMMGQGGDEFWCVGDSYNKKGHFIKVGCAHYLERWDQVGNPGQKGLHVGGLHYIAGYQSEGTVTHNIFIDPMDIYGIVMPGGGADALTNGAMTVKRYFVYSSFAGVNKNIYHSSRYAALTDAEYAELVQTAVKESTLKQDEAFALLNEIGALQTI